MSKMDIEYLKLKMFSYVENEQYEKAEVMKKWILDLGGDPKETNLKTKVEKKLTKKE
jgi:hypothetical protein